ncbi:competence protein CoiA [Arthrobacter crystallopoietes]|uniref:competence protein CoiA n=1 Tax=Crystallibacter crystallopoietes TaxID=37928 RepID=UPI0011115A0A|nr:hypothetical protein [Arthrobacter crystallopoietes]
MQLVAYLNGERIDATQMAHEPWRALVNDPGYKSLVLVECGLRASRVTLGTRQFFRHHRDVACSIGHKSESEQHLAMKRALMDRINAVPGWRAEVEHAHPDRAWIADVMAIHPSGRRLAFEVQLSPQNEDEYIRRSQRYAEDRVGAVWVVPDNLDWFRVRIPMIVTGFGKTSDLPKSPGALMDLSRYQPMFGERGSVGAAVDAVLHPAFRWPHGTPRHQLEEIARLEQMEAKAAAEKQEREEQAAELRRLAEDKAALAAAELAAQFITSAAAPAVGGARPVLAGKRIWASEVRCVEASHPMLIWRLTEQAPKRASTDPMWSPTTENFDNVRAHVDAWLTASGSSVAKAKVYQVKGWPARRTFVCPECEQIIQGRWVSALPPAKWSVIAEGSVASNEARDVRYRKPTKHAPPSVEKKQPAALPAHVEESDWRFIGPRRKLDWMTKTGGVELPYWMTEAIDAGELQYRLAAKEAHATRMQQLRANPRYCVSPNGFRFQCNDCGGEFEDDNEGIHTDGRCLIPAARSFSWR